ncbi:hypothetical protein Taro_027177, partial [Colocasia esculenta]|nr:hypothetical protein [Colocasia esculenta]
THTLCGLLAVVARSVPAFSGVEVELCSVEVVLQYFACETCRLGSTLPMRLVVWALQGLGRLVVLC